MEAEKLRSNIGTGDPEAWNDLKNAATRSFVQTRERIISEAKDAAEKVDQQAHRSPWSFMAVTGAIAALAGFLLGRKSKHQ